MAQTIELNSIAIMPAEFLCREKGAKGRDKYKCRQAVELVHVDKFFGRMFRNDLGCPALRLGTGNCHTAPAEIFFALDAYKGGGERSCRLSQKGQRLVHFGQMPPGARKRVFFRLGESGPLSIFWQNGLR